MFSQKGNKLLKMGKEVGDGNISTGTNLKRAPMVKARIILATKTNNHSL